ncbi:MAG: amino acid ABC transporter permease [Variibacter sp.]
MPYEWDFSVVWRYTDLLVAGGVGTILLFLAALAIAIPLGLILAVTRLSRIPILSHLTVFYIDVFRASPALVLIMWFYFVLPILLRVEFTAFTAATLALGLQSAAYMAEVYRSGIQAIGRGQSEAARSIGMSRASALWYIILPQAVKHALPVFFTRLIELLKSTALAAPITYAELVYNATEIAARTFRPVESFTVVALIYFVVIFAMSQLTRRVERRLALSD